jgi:hypothetical protein
MTVPANPTLTQVCAEYLVASNTPLSAFRRGAGIVPNTPINANVPTGLPIHLSQLAGSARYTNVTAGKSGNASGSFNYTPPPVGPTTVGISTNVVDAIAGGGNGGYTYFWQHISGDTFTGWSTSAASNLFHHGSVGRNQTRSGVYRCTISDGTTSAFVDVNVSVTFFYNL